jgi:hypothetical protein
MRLVLTRGQQLCFYPTFFTRGGSRRAAADSIIPVEPGAPPSWNCFQENCTVRRGFPQAGANGAGAVSLAKAVPPS